MRTVAHITHEAIQKIGGIGAVLQGLLTARSYDKNVPRTVLIGPLFDTGTDGDALKAIGTEERNQIEAANSFDIAAKLLGRLPRNERDVDEMIERGYEIAKKMSWEVVVEDYFLPGLHRALQNQA